MNVWYFHFRGEARYFSQYIGPDHMAEYEAKQEAIKSGKSVFIRTPEGVLWDVISPVKTM